MLARHKFTTLAGTLVFFLIMSLTPFLFWLTLLFGNSDIDFVSLGLFDWAQDFLMTLKRNAELATVGVNVLFLATTLFSSTGFFYHLRRGGEIIYGYERLKNGWKVRVSAALFTLGVLFLSVLAGGVLFATNLLTEGLPPVLAQLLRYAFSLPLSFLLAWLLNWYACPYQSRPSETLYGSIITSAAWFLASVAFSIYLRFVSMQRLYGALSAVIVFLIWLYWLMICLVAGIVYNCHRGGARADKRL